MSSPSHDPVVALNQVLSEVIDVVQEVKQAHRKVPAAHALHAELDRLREDLEAWAQRLLEQDEALGVSALGQMPSVAGRKPPNLWPGDPTDDEVRAVLAEHLDRVAQHVAAAVAEQEDERSRSALAEVERGVHAHRQALAGP